MKNWKKMIAAAAALSSLVLFAGCTTASAVSLDEAKDLVQQTVGAENAVVIEQETDRDDGVYELEIIVDGVSYEFEVDSRTGEVREVEREDELPRTSQPAGTVPAETQPTRITLEEAKAIAYAHAGVSEADAWDKSYENDDGMYEIDFEYDGWDYEYDISYSGEILKSGKEPDDDGRRASAPVQTQPVETKPVETTPAETAPAATAPSRISLEEAKAIAYAHAGVSEADAYDKSYENDDGMYEIDFEYDGWDYEYDIAYDGTIVKSRKDRDSDHQEERHHEEHHNTASDRITSEEAWSIALAHAGVTDVRDKDCEWDDGCWELSFESGRTEYEYKISADGTILKSEKDYND